MTSWIAGMFFLALETASASSGPQPAVDVPDPMWLADSIRAGQASGPRRSRTKEVLLVTGAAVIGEGFLFFNSAIAASAPTGFGIGCIAASPLIYLNERNKPGFSKADGIGVLALFSGVGVFNIVLGAGHHSKDDILKANVILLNSIVVIGFVASKLFGDKHAEPARGGSAEGSPWSAGFDCSRGAPALAVAYRF